MTQAEIVKKFCESLSAFNIPENYGTNSQGRMIHFVNRGVERPKELDRVNSEVSGGVAQLAYLYPDKSILRIVAQEDRSIELQTYMQH